MATNTYVALDKITVSGTTTSSITFNSIPQTYTDLVLAIQATADSGNPDSRIKFNGNTSNNMSGTILTGNGTTASSTRRTSLVQMEIDWTGMGTGIGQYQINIMNYANTTTYKTFLVRSAFAAKGTDAIVGLWSNTAAINSITVDIPAGYYVAGSTFSLYGILAEGISPAPKATGGAIYSDSTYYYHVFGATGTFTPLQSLSADVLVVAGGGGASSDDGGAGGAGGLCVQTGRSLTATGYSITVGAGGVGNSTNTRGGQGGNSTFDTITALGGGGGGYGNPAAGVTTGASGGSGGGGGYGGGAAGGSATQGNSGGATGYGNAGGSGYATGYYGTGGGGGAGGAGGNGSSTAGGNGGIGRTDSLINAIGAATGAGQLVSGNYYFAGGGGGSVAGSVGVSTPGTGGYGGGGAGNYTSGTPTKGAVNTGGGGGAEGYPGGSGIVVVRYAKA